MNANRGDRPPRLAAAALRRILPRATREPALGDLEEEWRQHAAGAGRRSADKWYWAQIPGTIPHAVGHRISSSVRGLGGLPREVALAARYLRRRPGLVASSFAALAVGLGSVTTIYTLADAVLLRWPAYTADERLVQVWNTYEDWQGDPVLDAFWDHIALSWPEYEDLADVGSLDELGLYTVYPQTLTDGGDPDEVLIGLASSTLFPMLGASPLFGRAFVAGEDGPDAPRIAMLAYDTWVGRFGGDPQVLGRAVSLSGVPYEIVGVLPSDFEIQAIDYPASERPAVWIPIGGLGEGMDRGNHSYEAIGRLAAGVGIDGARDEIAAVISGGASRDDQDVRVAPRRTEEIGDRAGVILPLSVGSALLLLIACGNFAILLLGDTLRRRRELATRAALGAGTPRLVRKLAVEGGLLGLFGATGGAALAVAGARIIMRFAPESLAGIEAGPSLSTLAPALGVGVGVGASVAALCGLIARDRAGTRAALGDRSGIGRGSGGRPGRAPQGVLLAVQVAFSVVLLVTATLLARSSRALSAVDPGFAPAELVSARLDLPGVRYSRPEATQFYLELAGDLRAEPGVDAVTLTSAVPFSGRGGASSFQIMGRAPAPDDPGPQGQRRTVLPGFHEVMGIPLREGRYLTSSDRIDEAPVVLVSETLADLYWPDGDAVGARISRDAREWEVVGVVGDALEADLSAPAQPTFYVPFEVAEERHSMNLVVRSALPLDAVGAAIRARVWAIDADLPVEDLTTIPALVARSAGEERFRSILTVLFALSATLLCATGLFGITSRFVTGRRREIGVQLALGARRADLARGVALAGGRPVLVGLGLGIIGAVAAAVGVSRMLFGVRPLDPGSFVLAVSLLSFVSAGAALIAAWRGTRLDPAEAIRGE